MRRPRRNTISRSNLVRRGVPKRLHKLTIDDIHDFGDDNRAKIVEYLKEYISDLSVPFNDAEGLYIFGSNGTGKTTIASILIKEAYIQRYTSRRVTFAEYIDLYTKTWNCKTLDEKETLHKELYDNYKNVEFLVLEEIGKEIDTKITLPILEDLLRHREDKGLPTIICTNLTFKAVSEKFGASVSSLLRGNMTPVKLVGVDRRFED